VIAVAVASALLQMLGTSQEAAGENGKEEKGVQLSPARDREGSVTS
jgi:hypothetical protein